MFEDWDRLTTRLSGRGEALGGWLNHGSDLRDDVAILETSDIEVWSSLCLST